MNFIKSAQKSKFETKFIPYVLESIKNKNSRQSASEEGQHHEIFYCGEENERREVKKSIFL